MPISNEERRALDQQLVEAAFVCDLMRVRTLLARGADPNARDPEGRTPIFSAVLGGSVALLGLLLETKADVNARDERGATALHIAAEEVVPEAATLLIGRGADVNAQDEEGNTPLARAVFSARGRYEVVRLLMKAGAKDDVANIAGETPRQLAERLGEPVFTAN
ncbi:MAG TPA: ankyrin repeat domain-containing protein [Polyangia bacterium]|nr:ankyrin repeat domain-containing protein [Polyangia bacterium]